jgi:hypothetical protein
MGSVTSDYAGLAERMLTHEVLVDTAAGCAAAVGRINQRLQRRFAPLIGVAGMRALFVRSVKLTHLACSVLAELPTPEYGDNADITVPVVTLLSTLDYDVARTVATALYANFIGLTSTLIGERLVMLVLQRAFPNLDVTAKQESE